MYPDSFIEYMLEYQDKHRTVSQEDPSGDEEHGR